MRGFWNGPWVVGGDFNVIRFAHEKNSHSRVMRSMRDFGEFINCGSLLDCPLMNARFTWAIGQEQPTLSELDRFLVSNDWEELYPRFSQEGLPKIVSDH